MFNLSDCQKNFFFRQKNWILFWFLFLDSRLHKYQFALRFAEYDLNVNFM